MWFAELFLKFGVQSGGNEFLCFYFAESEKR